MLEAYSDEIDLREYITTIWKWRRLITTITFAAIAIAGLLSFLILDPVYEASAQIVAPQTPLPAEIIKTPGFMQGIIRKLSLDDEEYDPFELADDVTVQPSKVSSSLTTITVPNRDAELAAKIANQIATDFLEFLRVKDAESSAGTIAQLASGKAEAASSLATVRDKMANLRTTSGLDPLETEVGRLDSLVSSYSTQQVANKLREQELFARIDELSRTLATVPPTVAGPPDWSGHPTQIPNETYQTLEQSIALAKAELAEVQTRLKEIDQSLPSLKADYEVKHSLLLELRRQLQELQTQESTLTQRVASFTEQISRLTVGVPETNLVSVAVVPIEPVSPHKLLNMAVAAALGGFLSVLVVFGLEYWRSPRKTATIAQ